MKSIPFWKYQAAGNDFVLFEEEDLDGMNLRELSVRISDRNFGAGSDGVIIAGKSSKADSRMYFFNPDGTPDVCGNGMRCIALHLAVRRPFDSISIETDASIVSIASAGRNGRFAVTSPLIEAPSPKIIRVGDETIEGFTVNTGTPHFVVFCESAERAPVRTAGPLLERHHDFPAPVSIDFSEVLSRDSLKIRIWERSAGETLSCGTGASAAAICAAIHKGLNGTQTVRCRGGDLLVTYDGNRTFRLEGDAALVYTGTLTS